jgi:hypothetical protein
LPAGSYCRSPGSGYSRQFQGWITTCRDHFYLTIGKAEWQDFDTFLSEPNPWVMHRGNNSGKQPEHRERSMGRESRQPNDRSKTAHRDMHEERPVDQMEHGNREKAHNPKRKGGH